MFDYSFHYDVAKDDDSNHYKREGIYADAFLCAGSTKLFCTRWQYSTLITHIPTSFTEIAPAHGGGNLDEIILSKKIQKQHEKDSAH